MNKLFDNQESGGRVASACSALRSGEVILLIDNAESSVSAYLIAAASLIRPQNIAFMSNHGRGVVLAAISESRISELGLTMMTSESSNLSPELTVSVEARQGVSTGISAADRAITLHTLAATKQPKIDLVMPGHIFPIRAKNGGVLVRNAAPEAAVDLLKMSGLVPTAALCHCLNKEGGFLSVQEIDELAGEEKLSIVTTLDIIRERLATETVVEKLAQATLPTPDAGEFTAVCFRSHIDDTEHLALIKGDLEQCGADGLQLPVLTRVQAEHHISDLLGTKDIRSRQRMKASLAKINQQGRGVFIYVRHPARSSLPELLEVTAADQGPKNSVMQVREYGIGAQILGLLGVHRIILLSSSELNLGGIGAFNIEIVGRVCY